MSVDKRVLNNIVVKCWINLSVLFVILMQTGCSSAIMKSTDKDATSKHILPLSCSNKKQGSFYSPVWTRSTLGNKRYNFCPPLLSWYATDGKQKDLKIFLGLMSEEWGGRQHQGFFMPFYAYRGTKEFYSLLCGWNFESRDKFIYPFTPLVGIRSGADYSGYWLFPLLSYKKSKKNDNYSGTFLWGSFGKDEDKVKSRLFPLYRYNNKGSIDTPLGSDVKYADLGKYIRLFPLIWYKNQLEVRPEIKEGTVGLEATKRYIKENGFFPLWSYSKQVVPQENKIDSKGSLLCFLYDYKHEKGSVGLDRKATDDYVRTRVLWRLWHYERFNDQVSVDVFPSITYDRKGDEFKKVSFLWHFFRYEKGKNGRKLDLLFIPILR